MSKIVKNALIIFCFSIIVFLVFFVFIRPFGSFRSVKGNDDFSKQINTEIGNRFVFSGLESDDEVTYYYYVIITHDKESISVLSDSINSYKWDDEEKVGVVILDSAGTAATAFALYNFFDYDLNAKEQDGFFRLYISDQLLSGFWRDYSLYTECIKNIRILEIPDVIQNEAESNNIDWFSEWPELERVIVYDSKTDEIIDEIIK